MHAMRRSIYAGGSARVSILWNLKEPKESEFV